MTTTTVQRLLMGAAIATALAALCSQTAFAQFGTGVDFSPDRSRHYTPEEKEKMREIDKQYQETLKKVPDKQKAYDPWAGARQGSSQDSSNGSTTKR